MTLTPLLFSDQPSQRHGARLDAERIGVWSLARRGGCK